LLQWLFGGMMGAAVIYGLIRGQGDAVMGGLLQGAEGAVAAALSMAGGFAFFCGLIGILEKAGAMQALARRLAPLMGAMMGREADGKAMEYIAMNLCANFLGMGNAATPMGIAAARRLAQGERASNALCLFLVMNAASVEILPTSVIALRAAAGSANAGAVALPSFLATFISAIAGIGCCKLAEKWA